MTDFKDNSNRSSLFESVDNLKPKERTTERMHSIDLIKDNRNQGALMNSNNHINSILTSRIGPSNRYRSNP